ncbi:MAG TPA: thrombospondin type 3 repeat-containing protein [Haliangium sp.]|nr:thrombospondin type 3 repeat-containing protein [Haliangium sp.]
MNKSTALSCLLTFAILPGCGDDGSGGDPPDAGQSPDAALPDGSTVGPVDMSGAIQKGPFVIGANVVVSMLDPATANPTGTNFPTTTRNDFGEFDVTLPGTGAAEIQTMGFYFNEVLDDVSAAPITMRALAWFPFSGPREVHVNVLTHLGHLRAKKLVRDGTDFEAAIAQAESELRAALPLATNLVVSEGTEPDILGGDSDANAYLFAASCVLAQTAVNEGPDSVDAELQEQMSVIALDLEDDGALQATLVDTLTRGARFLDADRCTANMEAFVAAKGSSAIIPDIRRALDFDRDGIGDRADNDADGDGRLAAEDVIVRVAGGRTRDTGLAVDEGGTVWTWSPSLTDFNGAGCDIQAACPPLPVAALSAFGPAREVVIAEAQGAEHAVRLEDGRVGWWGTSTGPMPALVPDLDSVIWIGGTAQGSLQRGGAVHAVRNDNSLWKIDGGTATQVTAVSEALAVTVTGNGTEETWVLRTDGTVQGHNHIFTQTYTVNGLTGAIALEAVDDGDFVLAVDGDGNLWRWSVLDAIVNGDTTATQVSMSGPVASLAPGGRFAVLEDGSVWRLDQGAPIMVTGIADVVHLSQSAALLRDGSVVTLELGAGTTAIPEPLYIPR